MTELSNHSVYFVPGLHRGLRVLEILAAADVPLRLADIAREMELSRSSAFRLVYTLRQLNFIKEGEQQNTYALGARVLNLGFAYLNQQPITSLARPHLIALRDKVEISAHLSVLEGHEVLYLGSHQARSGFVSNLRTGTRTEAYASAIGWVLLGALTSDELDAFCDGIEMTPFTEHTPTTPAALRARVTAAADAGYVVSRGYRDPGGTGIAAPVRDRSGQIVACVNISGPDSGFDFDKMDSFYVPALKEAAMQISAELGFVKVA